jgi:uncharacterized membrane protein
MTEKERRPGIQGMDGCVHWAAPTADCTGSIFRHVPRPRDLIQVIAGTSILAVPAGFTEETRLSQTLPFRSVSILSVVSLLLTALFVCLNFDRFAFNGHALESGMGVFSIHLVSSAVAGALLTVIRQAHWTSNALLLAIKRVMIAACPASIARQSADALKQERSTAPGGT